MTESMLVSDLTVPPPVPQPVGLASGAVLTEKPPAWLGPRAGGDLARLSPVSVDRERLKLGEEHQGRRDPEYGPSVREQLPFVVVPPGQAPTQRAISGGLPMPGALAITPDMSTANSSQETLHISSVSSLYAAAAATTHASAQMPGIALENAHESRSASPAPSEDDPHHMHDESADDLVCDQCQWRPRGVKENPQRLPPQAQERAHRAYDSRVTSPTARKPSAGWTT